MSWKYKSFLLRHYR